MPSGVYLRKSDHNDRIRNGMLNSVHWNDIKHGPFGNRNSVKFKEAARRTCLRISKLPKSQSQISSIRAIGRSQCGDKNPNWKGGKSFEPYPLGWTRTFKEQIRRRDAYRCQICSIPEVERKRRHDVHHIDYDKSNLDIRNLVTLCVSCHRKTNFNRDMWIIYFNCLINKIDEASHN